MTRNELVQLHSKLTTKAGELMVAKNTDYTADGSTFANFQAARIFNVHPVQGALVRLTDKMQRINSFIINGVHEVKDESVEDTIIDIINYAVLIAGMIEEEKQSNVINK